MEKLLLIDGNSLLFQMFFGMPCKIEGKQGQNIEGVWGFTTALSKLISKIKPTHMLVIFDGEDEQEIINPYKKTRLSYQSVPEEKNPYSILPTVKMVLEELKIKYLETKKGLTTSSYIKEYCEQYHNTCEIVISSYDYDYISLVNSKVSLITYKGENSTLYNEEKVKNKWKIAPQHFADYKALVGDSANNIAGIPRIGPKMAADLINQFETVENILEQKGKISKPNVRLTLDIFQNDLKNNLKLIRIERSNEIPINLEQLIWEKKEYGTKEILEKIEII